SAAESRVSDAKTRKEGPDRGTKRTGRPLRSSAKARSTSASSRRSRGESTGAEGSANAFFITSETLCFPQGHVTLSGKARLARADAARQVYLKTRYTSSDARKGEGRKGQGQWELCCGGTMMKRR